MAVLLPNVTLDTQRPTRTAAGLTTTRPDGTYLAGVVAHMEPNRVRSPAGLPDVALLAPYWLIVEAGTDIAPQDILLNIARLDTGEAYPGDYTEGQNTVWRVVHVTETAPVLIPCRQVFVTRATGAGPLHQ